MGTYPTFIPSIDVADVDVSPDMSKMVDDAVCVAGAGMEVVECSLPNAPCTPTAEMRQKSNKAT